MRISFLIWTMAMLTLNAFAQTKPFTFRNISINEGLSQSSVVDIAIDDAGFVWLATQDGLNRFDGKEFITFHKNFDDITTPTGSRLGKIFFSGKNDVWLITRGGKLEKLDLYTQSFYLPQAPGDRGPIPASASCIFTCHNETWIGTSNNGLYVYRSGDKPRRITSSSLPAKIRGNNVQQIFQDSHKQFWILTDHGLTRINNELSASTQFFTAMDQVKIPCSTIAEASAGTLWLGTFGKGLWIKTTSDSSFSQFSGFDKNNQMPADLVVETILSDKQGRIWIGTFGKGLFVIDAKHSRISHAMYKKDDPYSLGYNDVLSIKEDQRGGIWIGTDGGGISYFDDRLTNFETFSRNNLSPAVPIEQVRAITTDAGNNAWIGTSNSGLTVMDESPHSVGEFKKIGSLLTDKSGDIWVGTQEEGLAVLDSRTKNIKNRFLPGQTIWCMLEDKDGRVWAGTRHEGLYLVDKIKGVLLHLDTHVIADNNVRTLTKMPDDILCIGFEDKGVQFINSSTYKIKPVPAKSLQDVFHNNSIVIRSAFYQSPYLWIGSFGSGLVCFDIRTQKTLVISEKQGVPNNTIYGIHPGDSSSLWLSTNKGLCRLLIPKDPERITRSGFRTFTEADGIQANEFNTGAHYRSPEGKLYFGGINGFTVFDPKNLLSNNRPVPVVITKVLADNQPLHTDTVITYKKLLELPYSKNSLSFEFAGLDVISAGRMNYFYQLVGHDKDWVDAGNRNYVAYTNLPSGKFMFRVKASRNFSTSNSPVTELSIIIQPPFWRKAWFVLLCVLFVLSILYAIYRYRISQLIRLQKVRNTIASDLHDEIGSSLTNINILTELSRSNIREPDDTATFLNRITEEVTNSGQALDDIVWSINSNNDSLEQMVARMRRYVAEVFDSTLETYTVHFDDRFAHRKLNMEQRRDFFLLFKEIINNIYKHSSAKQVEIKVWFDKNKLKMEIEDDGIGFEPSAPTSRNGIRNMHARVQKWKGEIKIDSKAGKGTRIYVSMRVTN